MKRITISLTVDGEDSISAGAIQQAIEGAVEAISGVHYTTDYKAEEKDLS